MSPRTVRSVFSGLLLAGALLAGAPSLQAQDPPPEPPVRQEATELVFEREIFQYPGVQRRNPFRPLLAAEEGGPRFEQLRLMGILFSEEPGGSVAVVGTSEVSISADGSQVNVTPNGQAWYLKVGQSIGNTRIVEIRREQVVVEVEEFGLTEQRTMQLETRRLGGTP